MKLHGQLSDVTLNPTCRNSQDDGLAISTAPLQYGYQMKDLAEYNSKNNVTSLAIWVSIRGLAENK